MSKAMEGDLIRIVNAVDFEPYVNGDIFVVASVDEEINASNTNVNVDTGQYVNVIIHAGEYEVIRKQAHAAQVGDLIRITKARDEITAYKLGGIYEVISLEASNYNQIVISGINGNGYVLSDEYEIHRKLGEEDSDEQRVPPIRKAIMHVGERVIHPNKCRTGREFLVEIRAEKAEQFACAYAVDYDTKYDATDEQIRAIIQGGESDAVNSPNHYGQGRVETIEVIEDITSGYSDGYVAYCVGNTIKYLARAPHKHDTPTEDLRKAARYLAYAIDYLDAKSTQ